MRKRDIKIGQYYYCVNSIESLFFRVYPEKSLLTKFKMTDGILIMEPQNVFENYYLAKMKSLKILKKFNSEQMKRMDKIRRMK